MAERAGTPFWLWLNLISLDAPLIAVVWQDFLARCYPVVLEPWNRLALGLTVWAIYLADRLIDVSCPSASLETARHRFYQRHKRWISALLILVVVSDLFTATLRLQSAVLLGGLVVAAAVACYFALFVRHAARATLWKQRCAALLFTSGTFLVAWTQAPARGPMLALASASFGLLCWGNLTLIESWESSRPARTGTVGMWLLTLLLTVVAGSRWYSAITASAATLSLLSFQIERLSQDSRRALADAALLTPLLFR